MPPITWVMLLEELSDGGKDVMIGPRLGWTLNNTDRGPRDVLGLHASNGLSQTQTTYKSAIHFVAENLDTVTTCTIAVIGMYMLIDKQQHVPNQWLRIHCAEQEAISKSLITCKGNMLQGSHTDTLQCRSPPRV